MSRIINGYLVTDYGGEFHNDSWVFECPRELLEKNEGHWCAPSGTIRLYHPSKIANALYPPEIVAQSIYKPIKVIITVTVGEEE